MSLELVADQILNAVQRIAAETRYEEKSYREGSRIIEGANAALRAALGAPNGQVNYPSSGDLCDVVVHGEFGPVWLEVKHSWTWMTYRNPGGPNKSYTKHLLGDGGDSALHDARSKLPRLIGANRAATIGMLVIALDSTQLPHPAVDLDRLARISGMDQEPWQRFTRVRWTSRAPGYESIGIQPFLWLRPGAAELVAR